jgi:hypothetical protein
MRRKVQLAGAGLLAGLLTASLTGPAHATQNLYCEFSDDVSVNLLMGTLEVAAVVRADITAAGQRWSTQAAEGLTVITVG